MNINFFEFAKSTEPFFIREVHVQLNFKIKQNVKIMFMGYRCTHNMKGSLSFRFQADINEEYTAIWRDA